MWPCIKEKGFSDNNKLTFLPVVPQIFVCHVGVITYNNVQIIILGILTNTRVFDYLLVTTIIDLNYLGWLLVIKRINKKTFKFF